MTEFRSAEDEAAIALAARILRAGGLVAFPTETVYGLGAAADSPLAVAKIYAAKGRPSFNPLIAHVASLDAARREALLSDTALRLAEKFWPGPLTLVAPVSPQGGVCDLARAGLASVALRIPSHPRSLALLRAFGGPVAAPSANISGHVSPVTARHVEQELGGRIDLILDGGRSIAGLESTIVSFLTDEPMILRPGAITREALQNVIGGRLRGASGDSPITSPGMTASHYAPRAKLRLDALSLEPGEAGIDFAGAMRRGNARGVILDLSPTGDLTEAAANIYVFLRELDERGIDRAGVAPIPSEGLGEAIRDRLRRAAVR